jgi:hypothetical protein
MEKWTLDQLSMWFPPTLRDSDSATSSPASADGAMPSVSPGGQTTSPCGLAPALASLSPRQAKEKGLLTSGTFGPRGTGSLESANLASSLASRLQARLDGSILYRQTWKQRATPSGRQLLAHTASAPRTSASASTGWPTPTRQDGASSGAAGYSTQSGRHSGTTLTDAAGWATPTSRDHKDGAMQEADVPINSLLGRQVTLSSAATASAGQLNPEHSRWLMGYPVEWGYCGATAMQSFRKSRKRS